MALLKNPEQRFWRTDFKRGRGIYALVSNDVTKPSEYDPVIGVMENSELAETIVDTHNRALEKFGRNYLKVLMVND